MESNWQPFASAISHNASLTRVLGRRKAHFIQKFILVFVSGVRRPPFPDLVFCLCYRLFPQWSISQYQEQHPLTPPKHPHTPTLCAHCTVPNQQPATQLFTSTATPCTWHVSSIPGLVASNSEQILWYANLPFFFCWPGWSQKDRSSAWKSDALPLRYELKGVI